MSEQVTEEQSSLHLYRVAMFEEMGFSTEIAEELAETRGADGFHISTHSVRDMISKGCSLELALKIVL